MTGREKYLRRQTNGARYRKDRDAGQHGPVVRRLADGMAESKRTRLDIRTVFPILDPKLAKKGWTF